MEQKKTSKTPIIFLFILILVIIIVLIYPILANKFKFGNSDVITSTTTEHNENQQTTDNGIPEIDNDNTGTNNSGNSESGSSNNDGYNGNIPDSFQNLWE